MFILLQLEDTFMGQAIIRVKDYQEQIYKGEKVEFTDYPLVNYVAPVENTAGVAEVILNVALQQRQVTGTCSFSIQVSLTFKTLSSLYYWLLM